MGADGIGWVGMRRLPMSGDTAIRSKHGYCADGDLPVTFRPRGRKPLPGVRLNGFERFGVGFVGACALVLVAGVCLPIALAAPAAISGVLGCVVLLAGVLTLQAGPLRRRGLDQMRQGAADGGGHGKSDAVLQRQWWWMTRLCALALLLGATILIAAVL